MILKIRVQGKRQVRRKTELVLVHINLLKLYHRDVKHAEGIVQQIIFDWMDKGRLLYKVYDFFYTYWFHYNEEEVFK